MTTKKTILMVVISFLLSNILTTIWYMLTDEANMVPYRRPEMNYLALTLNHFIYAGLMVYLFPFYYDVSRTRIRGFIYGCLIAAIMYLPQAMVIRAIWKIDFNTIFVLNSIAHIAIGGIMGLAISFVYDYKRKE